MGVEPQPGRRAPLLWNLLKVLLALFLIGFVLSKADWTQLGRLHERISLPWLFAALGLYVTLTLVKARQYSVLLGGAASYPRVLNIVILQNAISNFLATSAGIASYLTFISADEGVKFRKGVASFLVTKIGDLLAVSLLLLIGALWAGGQAPVLRSAAIILLCGVAVALAALLATILMRQRFVALLNGLLDRLRLRRLSFVRQGLGFLQYLADQGPGAIFRILRRGAAYSLLYMALTLAWSYSGLRVYSMPIPLREVILVVGFVQLVSWIPIQVFGGLGVTETTLVYLYGQFGVPQAEMAAVSIGLRLLLILANLLVLAYLPLGTFFARRGRQAADGA